MSFDQASTIDQAKTDFVANIDYWASAEKAANFAKAVTKLLAFDPKTMLIGSSQYSRESLENMRSEAIQYARSASTNRPAMFSRTRVTGMGNY